MAIFEFSDDFDAQGWYTEQMLKGRFQGEEEECDWYSEQSLAYWD